MATQNNHDLQADISTTDDSEPEFDSPDHESSYQAISFQSDSDPDSEPESDCTALPVTESNGGLPNCNPNPNPNPHSTSNGIHALDLNGGGEADEEEAEVEREREASVLRAFREDEDRRNAPLTPENASRVMDAMRGVSFPGSRAPEWAGHVSEERWVDRLRRLRGEPTAAAATNAISQI